MQLNLLDTHTFLWFIGGNRELSKTARAHIEADNTNNFVSIASLWEMSIKISLGKLHLNAPFSEIGQHIIRNGFEILPITVEDTLILSTLPFHHRDPFDRIIVAQALNNSLTVITKDDNLASYGAKVVW